MDKFLVKKIVFLLSALVLTCLFNLTLSTSALAYVYHSSPIDAGYNTTLISDAAFVAKDTLTTEGIQSFLVSKMPICDTWGQKYIYDSIKGYSVTRAQYSLDRGVSTPFICLRDYSEGGKTAAQIIKDAANDYDINPQVILVILEKEQSLVRDDWPWQWNYNRAMGMACPESGGCDAAFAGFTNQVRSGSRLLKAVYNKSCNPSVGPFYEFTFFNTFRGIPRELDYVSTNIDTCATAALYQYTPHRVDSAWIDRGGINYYGNYNFVTYYNSWFDFNAYLHDRLLITSSLALSNPTPAIGELITATYEITNTSPSPVTLSYVGVSNRLGGYYGAGYDLGWDQNITIAAGATYPVHVASAMTEPGAYSYWAAYVLNGVFYYALPQTNQMTSGTFVAHNPNIVVTNAITVNPNQPISGQSSRYSVTVTNYEPNRIYYSNIGLPANNSATGAMVDISWLSNSYIESGASLTIQQDKTFPAGRYYAWPYLNIGSKFYGIYDAGYDSRLTYFRFEVKDLQYAYPVTAPISISNPTPAIGEVVNVAYRIKNNTLSSVTFDYVGVPAMLNGNIHADIGWQQNVTVAAGASYDVVVYGIPTERGVYTHWASFVINGRFYWAVPDTTQAVFGIFPTHNPNIVVTNAITVNPNQPISGQSSRYSVTVTNYEPNRIYYSNIGLPANNSATGAMVDISWLSNSYIESGASLTIQQDKTFPAGRYYAWPYLNIGSKFYGIYDAGYDSRLTYFRFEVLNQ